MHNSKSLWSILGNFWMDISLSIQNYALWEMVGAEGGKPTMESTQAIKLQLQRRLKHDFKEPHSTLRATSCLVNIAKEPVIKGKL